MQSKVIRTTPIQVFDLIPGWDMLPGAERRRWMYAAMDWGHVARQYGLPESALAYLDDRQDMEDLAGFMVQRRTREERYHRRRALAYGVTLVWALIIGAGLNLPLWLELPPFLALFGGTLWHLAWYAGFLGED